MPGDHKMVKHTLKILQHKCSLKGAGEGKHKTILGMYEF